MPTTILTDTDIDLENPVHKAIEGAISLILILHSMQQLGDKEMDIDKLIPVYIATFLNYLDLEGIEVSTKPIPLPKKSRANKNDRS